MISVGVFSNRLCIVALREGGWPRWIYPVGCHHGEPVVVETIIIEAAGLREAEARAASIVKFLSAPATQTSPDEKPRAPSEAALRSDMAVHKAARPDRGERPVAQRPHSQGTKLGMPQPTPMAGRRNTSLWCAQTKTRRHPEEQRR